MKITVDNISYAQYFTLDAEQRSKIDYVLRYGNIKAEDCFELGDFDELPYGVVKECQELMNTTGMRIAECVRIISEYKGIDIDKIASSSFFDIYKTMMFIRDGVNYVNELEQNNLGHTATAEEEAAGIEELAGLGQIIQLDNLAHGQVWNYKEVEATPYILCFAKLKKDKLANEFEKRVSEIRNKRH